MPEAEAPPSSLSPRLLPPALGARPRHQSSPSLLESTRSKLKLMNNHVRVVFFGVSENQSHARARGRKTHRTRGQDLLLGWAPRLAQPYPSAREPQEEPQPAPAPGVPVSGRLSLQQRLGSGFITASSLHRPHYTVLTGTTRAGARRKEQEGHAQQGIQGSPTSQRQPGKPPGLATCVLRALAEAVERFGNKTWRG